MNLIVFDLELNRYNADHLFDYHGADQSLRGEVIQIGAAKIDAAGHVLETFHADLKPRIFRRLSPFVAKVTGFTQKQMDAGIPVREGLARFVRWCGEDAVLLEWGMDDVPVLRQNLFLNDLDECWPSLHYDLQQIFVRQVPQGEGDKLNLESVVTRLGLPMERQYHDALADALYTADIAACLDLTKGMAEYPDEAEQMRRSMCSVPETTYYGFTDFGSCLERDAWNTAPQMTEIPCPDCGAPLVPDAEDIWVARGKNSRYTVQHCPEHGDWMVRFKRIQWDGLHWNFARVLEKTNERLNKRWKFDRARCQKQRQDAAAAALAEQAAAETETQA